MTEDYEDLLDQNVDEVKKSIREMDDPDYEKILSMEKGGKDRKTVREFLEDRIDSQEVEIEGQDMEEVVEEIEEETEGGILGSFSGSQILAGGLIAGIVIGLLAGYAINMDQPGNEQAARDAMNQLFEASDTDAEIIDVESVSGVYQVTFNRTVTNPLTNQTQEVSGTAFVSKDGRYIFQGSTVEQQLQAIQRQRQLARNQTSTGN